MLLFLLKTETFSFYWKQVKGLRVVCILHKLIPAASFTSSPTLHPLTHSKYAALYTKVTVCPRTFVLAVSTTWNTLLQDIHMVYSLITF